MDSDSFRRVRVPLLLMLVMAGVLVGAYGYEPEARALPVLVAWSTIGLLVLEILVQAGTPVGRRIDAALQSKGAAPEPERVPVSRALVYAVGWPGLLVAMIILIGILPAVLVYVFLSLKLVGGKSLTSALTAAFAVTAFAWTLFEWGMSYQLFRGVLMGDFGGF